MEQGYLLVGTDDFGLPELKLLQEQGIERASGELGFSGGVIRRFHDENFDVQLVKLDSIVEALQNRTSHGFERVDGVCVMSCRPYGDGAELRKWTEHIRNLGDSFLAFPHVPARVLPIIQADLKHAFAGRSVRLDTSRWSGIVPSAPSASIHELSRNLDTFPERTFDHLFRLVRNWRLDLVLDLEIGGLIVARRADGSLIPRVALRRKMEGGDMHLAGFHPPSAQAAGLPIFSLDLDLDREPFTALHDMLDGAYRRYARMDRTKTEITLHRFLDENPELLRSETYTDFLTETCFQIRNGSRGSMRPDLILRPMDCHAKTFNLVELKLPSDPVVVHRKGGFRLSSRVLRAINQVRAYRDRLTDPANADEVFRHMKELPEQFEMAVLIGMRRDGEPRGIVDDLRAEHDVMDVSIIRYNELAQFGLKLHGRESPVLVP